MEVVSRTHLFHYALHSASHLDAIVREGLRPLSDFPESERWRAIEAELPGFFESVYARVAEPVLGTPYERSGVFLTPIDFACCPGRCSRSVCGCASRSSGSRGRALS